MAMINYRRAGYLFVMIVAIAACELNAAESNQISDQKIAAALERQLLNNANIEVPRVDAKVENGTVTLSGSVTNLLSKERAGKIARSIRGVRKVNNEIAVNPPQRPDVELKNDIEAAFRADPAIGTGRIVPLVKDGVVTLGGRAKTQQEKQLILNTVEGIRGVRAIDDQIRIQKQSERPDEEVAEDVRNVLASDAWVDARRIDVKARQGIVLLSGEVGSVAQKNRATALANVTGVRDVNPIALEVNPSLPDMMRETVLPVPTREEIRNAVIKTFERMPRVPAGAVNVKVDDTVVTLSGIVEDYAAKRAALHAARNIRGVSGVRDNLHVRPSAPVPNEDIANDVRAAFSRDPYLHDEALQVRSSLGIVTLAGEVDSAFEKRHAEDVVARIRGVVTIANGLAVRKDAPLSPEEEIEAGFSGGTPQAGYGVEPPITGAATDSRIRERIEDELRTSPLVHAGWINVHVQDGVATLTGVVRSAHELGVAIQNAREGGAVGVRNNLHVKASPDDIPLKNVEKVVQ